MKKKKYLIACLDGEDKIHEMKEYYLLLVTLFQRESFKMDKEKFEIFSSTLVFQFKTPNELNCLDDQSKFSDVIGSQNFINFASFDSKHAYKYFKIKDGKVNPNGLLKKLAKSRKQQGR